MKKKRRKRIQRGTLLLLIIAICFILAVRLSYAANESWYINNKDILSQNSLVGGALRGIGWLIVTVVVKLCDGCQTLYETAFNFLDVTKLPGIEEYIERFKPVVIALMALSLLFLGYTLMIEHEKKPKIMVNICIVILCVTSSASIFSSLNEWTIQFKDAVTEGYPETAAMDVIQNNIADLVYLNYAHENGLEDVNWSIKEEYGTSATFDEIDYAEVLNPKSTIYNWRGNTKTLLGNYYHTVPEPTTSPVENGFGWNASDDADFGNKFYFRYKFNFLEALIELCSLIIIYITMSYKVVRVAFELVVARLLAYLYSAELSGGEKIKKIIVFIRDSYTLLVVTSLCIRVYLFFSAWIGTQWNPLIRSLFLLFLAFAVIDGPNLVEKLLGMDAGLKSSTARMLAIGRAASGFGKAAGGAAIAKNVAQKVNNVKSGEISRGGLVAGAYGGIFGKAMTDGDAKTASTSERVGGFMGVSKAEKKKRAQEREASGGWGGSNGFNAASGGASKVPSSETNGTFSGSSGEGTSGSDSYNASQGYLGNNVQAGSSRQNITPNHSYKDERSITSQGDFLNRKKASGENRNTSSESLGSHIEKNSSGFNDGVNDEPSYKMGSSETDSGSSSFKAGDTSTGTNFDSVKDNGSSSFIYAQAQNPTSSEASSKGEKGDSGQNGKKGEKGAKGDRGNTGLEGKRGAHGEKGKEGDLKEAFSPKNNNSSAKNSAFEVNEEKPKKRSFMDQNERSFTSESTNRNGNRFMNGGVNNGNKNNDTKHRK